MTTKIAELRTRTDYSVGVLLVVVSAVTFSTAGLFTKGVSAGPWDVIFWRGVFAAAFTTVWTVCNGKFGDNFARMGWSGVAVAIVGALGTAAFIAAFKLTTVANVSVIYAVSPLLARIIHQPNPISSGREGLAVLTGMA